MNDLPKGTTHLDNGPSITKYIRVGQYIHDYWSEIQDRWVTFEAAHNGCRNHWQRIR